MTATLVARVNEHYANSWYQLAYRERNPLGPPPSDVAHWFQDGRWHAFHTQRLTPQLENDVIMAALVQIQQFTGLDWNILVRAVNVQLLMKNPKDDDHVRHLRAQLVDLDAQQLAMRPSGVQDAPRPDGGGT